MVGRFTSVFLASALLLGLLIVPVGQAPCPENVKDCQAIVQKLTSSAGTSVTAQLTAGNYFLDATLDVGGKAKEGSQGMVIVTVSANSASAAPANLSFTLAGAVGVTWDLTDTDGLAEPGYGFTYDPAQVGAAFPTWTFRFQVNDTSQIVVPIGFAAQEPGGPRQTDAGLLPMNVASDGGRMTLAQWALPALLGLVVGALLSAVLLRRRKA